MCPPKTMTHPASVLLLLFFCSSSSLKGNILQDHNPHNPYFQSRAARAQEINKIVVVAKLLDVLHGLIV